MEMRVSVVFLEFFFFLQQKRYQKIKIKNRILSQVAAFDQDFIEANKITHIVNCAGTETPNVFSASGIKYLTFPWKDTPFTVILDETDRAIVKVADFIDDAHDLGECVLIHSVDAKCLCCDFRFALRLENFFPKTKASKQL